MIKVNYTELDGPAGPTCRLEASGHARYAPLGQDIVCASASTLMQTLCALLAGEEGTKSSVWNEPEGCRLAVTAVAPQKPWVEGAFEFAKQGFAMLAERYPDNLRFADLSERGEKSMLDLQMFAATATTAASGGNREEMLGPRPAGCKRSEADAGSRNPVGGIDLQMFAESGEGGADAPALSHAQAQQAIASGTMKAEDDPPAAPARPAQNAPEAAEKPPAPPEERPAAMPDIPRALTGERAVRALHARWAAEEAMMRRDVPDFSLKKELADPEMRRLMELPGMRMGDAYRLAHYNDALRQTAQTVEQGVVERIRQRAARPSENGNCPGGAAVTHADVASMTRAQREALERRAMHGAEIVL